MQYLTNLLDTLPALEGVQFVTSVTSLTFVAGVALGYALFSRTKSHLQQCPQCKTKMTKSKVDGTLFCSNCHTGWHKEWQRKDMLA